MGSKAPSWADQWGSESFSGDEDDKKQTGKKGSNKKLADVKAAASTGFDKAKAAASVSARKVKSAGFDKAKAAASVSAQKVKSGTSLGIEWVKNQYQKRSSK